MQPVDITPRSSWKFDPCSPESSNEYAVEVSKLRQRALASPPVVNHVLTCQGPSMVDTTVDLSNVKVHEGYRVPIADLLASSSAACSTSELRLRFIAPLQTGPDLYGQVWTCQVISRSVTESPELVVLKLFQESLSLLSFHGDFGLHRGYVPVDWHARREACAYSRLKKLQGKSMPYSYGTYTFILPCGEQAWGHLMEFIPCPTLTQYMESRQNDSTALEKAFEASLASLMLLRQNRCLHRDIRGDNVMIDDRSQNLLQAIIIDFGVAFMDGEPGPLFGRDDLFALRFACMANKYMEEAQVKWVDANPDSPFLGPA